MSDVTIIDTAAPHEMRIIDHTGDTKLIWSPGNEDEVDAVRTTFDKLRRKGHIAYSVKPGGDKGEVVTAFDPKMEKLILTPPLAGG